MRRKKKRKLTYKTLLKILQRKKDFQGIVNKVEELQLNYEPFQISELIKKGFKEGDIIVTKEYKRKGWRLVFKATKKEGKDETNTI